MLIRAQAIIIGFTQLLGLLFSRIRQPRVIAEVIVRVSPSKVDTPSL
jgi:Kef-type K+ transport system membrane component KefB